MCVCVCVCGGGGGGGGGGLASRIEFVAHSNIRILLSFDFCMSNNANNLKGHFFVLFNKFRMSFCGNCLYT